MAAVGKVAVVTESVACLPGELVGPLGVTVVPVPFRFAGRDYLDGVDVTPEEFNRVLRPNLPPAVTSAPSPAAYAKEFCRLGDEGRDVLCVCPTPAVTRMFEAAAQGRDLAREEGMKGRIEVVDSGTATMAQGFVALEAARSAKDGSGMDEVLRRAREISERVYLLVTLDTLDYLAKTARVPRVGVLFGKVLQVKPIILFARGEVEPLERPRARRRAVRRLLDLTEERLRGDMPLRAAVQHAAVPEEAEALRGAVEERFAPEEILVSEFSPVMTSFAGPGLLGLAFYEDRDGLSWREAS